MGLALWWIGVSGATPADVDESIVEDFRAWHFYSTGIGNWPTNHVTIDGYVARGERYEATGMAFADYSQKGLVVKNADIQGLKTGIILPVTGGTTIIQDSYLRNFKDVVFTTMSTSSYRSDQIAPGRPSSATSSSIPLTYRHFTVRSLWRS